MSQLAMVDATVPPKVSGLCPAYFSKDDIETAALHQQDIVASARQQATLSPTFPILVRGRGPSFCPPISGRMKKVKKWRETSG